MLFIIITVLGLLAVLFRQTYLRFRETSAAEGKRPGALSPKAYWTWLRNRHKAVFTKESSKRAENIFRDWTANHYPGRAKWIFIGLGLSFLYQVASGLFFAVFIPRGMFGLPLLGHMGMGGLFGLSLAALLMWRGRAYRPDKEETEIPFPQTVLFWAFAALGLIQVATALGSMLPVFTFETQQAFIAVHRYSALAILLAALIFIDIAFIPQRRP